MDLSTLIQLVGPTLAVLASAGVAYLQIKVSISSLVQAMNVHETRLVKLESGVEVHRNDDFKQSTELNHKLERIPVLETQLHNLQTTVNEIKEELKEMRRHRDEKVKS